MHRIIKFCLAAILALPVLTGCATGKAAAASSTRRPVHPASPHLGQARDAAMAAMKATKRKQIRAHALHGIDLARRCIADTPEEAGCYYWRAVNTGLYHSAHAIGYQAGIKAMISDCEKVIELSADYEYAGAYRMLGQIYTQLPQTAGRPDSIVRDLDLAETYLRTAVELAPQYPENHLALAEVLLGLENFEETLAEINKAKELAPGWSHDISYGDWRRTALSLEKKAAKATK